MVNTIRRFGAGSFQGAWLNAYYWEFKDYNDFVKKYARDAKMGSETWVSFNSMAAFFEGIGVLLRRRLIDIRLVDDLFSTPIKQTWELTKPIIEGERALYERPQIWEWFEYLYNEMQRREQRLQQTEQ